MAKHWSERLACSACGMSFRSASAEAAHRHNFPAQCRPPKPLRRIHAGRMKRVKPKKETT